MAPLMNGELKKSFEKIIGKSVDETIADKIVRDVQKWLNEEILPYLPFEVVKYKRDEHLAINTALTGPLEEKIKKAVCPLIPKWMGPDVLTAIGIIGAVLSSLGFYFGLQNKDILVLVLIGLFINWFGDSFDGSIARYWKRTRPNYGYYIDHIIDGISVFIVCLGIGYSGFILPDTAYLLIISYLLLEMHVLLVKTVENTFKYTFGLMGPTEGRIIVGIFTIYMYFSDIKQIEILGKSFSQYDVGILVFASIMIVTLLACIISEGLKLHAQDIKKWEAQ